MPLGLLSLAASLRETGFSVKLYRPKLRLLNKKKYQNIAIDILSLKPDIIGFSTWCNTFAGSLLIAQKIKYYNHEIPIIFGGPQASIIPTEILKKISFVDYVLTGEADYTLPQLLKELNHKKSNLSKIVGLAYRNENREIIVNKISSVVKNVDNLPVPAYDLISKPDILKLDVGRGCPFECTYCTTNNFFSKSYRVKSPERILYEMDLMYEKSKITSFSFAHDLFTLNKKFICSFCSNLIQYYKVKNIKFKWTCSSRIDCVSEQLITKMKSSGCQSIFFGIESGSEKIQKSIKKNLRLSSIYAITDKCRQVDMKMHASFIFGFPDETKADIEKTLKLIIELACKGALVQASELALLPGTPLYNNYSNQLKFDGSISNFSYSLIGKLEKTLIQKYPLIFSSFYYLPVSSMSRSSIVYLCRFINTLREFRNTMFLIENEIKNDLKNIKLLNLFFETKNEIRNQIKSDLPLESLIIKLIKNYLKSKFKDNIPIQIRDVFMWEATQALLKSKKMRWQLVASSLKCKKTNRQIKDIENREFISSPVWHLLKSNYDFKLLIPEKNNWKREFKEKQKGEYYYLIVAKSDKYCKMYSLNSKKFILLKTLQNNSFEVFLKKTISEVKQVKTKKWLKELNELGVIFEQ